MCVLFLPVPAPTQAPTEAPTTEPPPTIPPPKEGEQEVWTQILDDSNVNAGLKCLESGKYKLDILFQMQEKQL